MTGTPSPRDLVEQVYNEHVSADWNEATTRIRVINRILNAVGWTPGNTEFEVPSGTGDYLDYLLRWCGEPWLVVEAKRTSMTFSLDPTAFRSSRSHLRSVDGLLRKGGANLRDAMAQAASYANDRATPFCAVTNGHQWLFFRGLSSEKRPWRHGKALIFLSPLDVLSRFDDFLDCLGHSGRREELPRLLDQPTTGELPEPAIPSSVLRLRRGLVDHDLMAQVGVLSSYLLTDIHLHDRLAMLDRCYVSSNEPSQFDTSIRRLLKDSASVIDDEDVEVLDGDVERFRSTVELRERTSGEVHPVIIVGHIGAGKTTFVHRAFRSLKLDKVAFSAVVDLEGIGRAGTFHAKDEHQRVAERVLERLGWCTTAVLKKRDDIADRVQADPHATATLRTLCRVRLAEAREVAAHYWEAHPDEWGLKVLEVIDAYREDKVAWLIHFINHLRSRFRRPDDLRYPVLIAIDNIDQASSAYQKCVYGLAQQLARQTPAIVVVCIREDTYREGRLPKGFLSSTPMSFVFHVQSPPLDRVLKVRLDHGTNYFVKNTPPALREVRDAIPDWCGRVELLLAGRAAGAELISSLAGQNTRLALDLSVRVIRHSVDPTISGEGSAGVLHALLVGSTSETLTERVGLANLFDCEPSLPPLHGLRARLLAYLYTTSKLSHTRPVEEAVPVVLARFGAWGYPVALVRRALLWLLAVGLICDAKQRRSGVFEQLPSRLGLTASGLVHLTRLARERQYRLMMACATRWYQSDLARRFTERCEGASGDDGCTFGDLFESTADDFFEAYLRQALATEEAHLVPMSEHAWVRNVLANSNAVFKRPIERDTRTWQEKGTEDPAPGADGGSQVDLFTQLPRRSTKASPNLGRIPRNTRACGVVWVPRILWALEWGRQAGHGPMSPSEIASTLRDHADIDVPHNNVSRAFRDLKKKPAAAGLWSVQGKRYEITEAGTSLIVSLIESDVREA